MTEAIIVGLIAGGASILAAFLTSNKNQAVTDTKLEAIEKKLDIHNGYADKIGTIQSDIASIKTEIENIKEAKK